MNYRQPTILVQTGATVSVSLISACILFAESLEIKSAFALVETRSSLGPMISMVMVIWIWFVSTS